jgi:hypothetical protein
MTVLPTANALVGRQQIRSFGTTGRVQQPNKLTRYFQQMKETCPDRIRSYAKCVVQAESAGALNKGVCEQEFAQVKACFRQVRRQQE